MILNTLIILDINMCNFKVRYFRLKIILDIFLMILNNINYLLIILDNIKYINNIIDK